MEALETLCPRCKGKGGRWNWLDNWEICARCKGAGWLPTQLGEKIIDLIRHQFSGMMRK